MIPSAPAIEKLRALEVYMLAEPRRVNMDHWVAVVDPKHYDELDYDLELEGGVIEYILAEQRPPCGAIGCIAGSLCIMEGKIEPSQHFDGSEVYTFDNFNTIQDSTDILGISKDDGAKLFYLTRWGWGFGWPEPFESQLGACKSGTQEYVQVIVDRIEHYIATGE